MVAADFLGHEREQEVRAEDDPAGEVPERGA
jgi:hypothetical protein